MSDPGPPQPVRSRRAARRAIAFAVGVAVLVSAIVAALVLTSTADGATGPEAAARDFLAAAAAGDLGALVDQLPPAEREAVEAELPGLGDELRRLGVSPGAGGQAGVRVELRDVQLLTEQPTGEVGRVRIVNGELVIHPGSDETVRRHLADTVKAVFGVEVDADEGPWTIALGDRAPSLMTLRDGGGWHVSLVSTLAEAARTRDGDTGPLPRYGEGPPAKGAPTPEAAVRDLFGAAEAFDPISAVQLLLAHEARGIYDYSTLFLPEAIRQGEAVAQVDGAGILVTDFATAVEGEGSTRTVRVTAFEGVVSTPDERTVIGYDGRCTTIRTSPPDDDADVTTTTHCDGDAPVDAAADDAGPAVLTSSLRGLPGGAFPVYTVEERNGRWYLSPIRTVLGTLRARLHALPDGALASGAVDAELAGAWALWRGILPA